MFCSQRVIPVT